MMYLEQNIKGLCEKNGLEYKQFLTGFEAKDCHELSIRNLEFIAKKYETTLNTLLFKNNFKTSKLKAKLAKIKLLILDVDGVMTDGGMYITHTGDQFKKFNTKDGMAIIHLTKNDFQVAIISSGFKGEAVHQRAKMLGIQHCTVSRAAKMDTLKTICTSLDIGLENVAMIGDDINDLSVMKNCGLAVCPKDAVTAIKNEADIILSLKGGEGCVREFIDQYLLEEPIT